jgi:hypothetical protein
MMDYNNPQFVGLLNSPDIRKALGNRDFTYLYKNLESYDLIIQFTQFCHDVLKVDPLNYMDYIPYYYLKGSGIKNYTVPSNITSIGEKAFAYCQSLENITIPNTVKGIDFEAFKGCTNLKSINIPNGVTSIGKYAFYNCPSLTSVTIGSGVTSIDEWTFGHCSSLTNLVIGDGVTNISKDAFYKCLSLTIITIPDNVTSVDIDAFGVCPIVQATIPATACSAINNKSLKDVIITSGDAIKDYAFFDCGSLTRVEIPASVTSIGEYAFTDCPKLKEIIFRGTKEESLICGLGDKSFTKWRGGSPIEKIICTDGEIKL